MGVRFPPAVPENQTNRPAGAAQKPRTIKVAYKKDQGRHVRMAAYWILLFIAMAGLYKFRFWLDGTLGEWARKNLFGQDFLGIPTSFNVFLCIALTLGTAYLLLLFLNRPKTADLLIETEAELKKCTWPTLRETWDASVVVVITVIVIGLFLAGSDVVLSRILNVILYSGLNK